MAVFFVAGATGYVGRNAVAELARRGQRVVAHVRPGSRAGAALVPRFEALGAEVDRTPWEPAAMAATLARVEPDAVLALLGTTRRRARAAARRGERADYAAVDRDLTLLLLRAAVASGAAPRFVYLSALGVEGGAGAYYAARRAVEEALRDGALPWIIARPGFVSGPDRDECRPGERLAAVLVDAALGLLAALGARRLRERYASLDGPTVARALVDLALDPEAARRVVGPEELRRRGTAADQRPAPSGSR